MHIALRELMDALADAQKGSFEAVTAERGVGLVDLTIVRIIHIAQNAVEELRGQRLEVRDGS